MAMTHPPTLRKPTEGRTIAVGDLYRFLATGDETGDTPPPPSKAEIEKLLAVAPKYGIESCRGIEAFQILYVVSN